MLITWILYQAVQDMIRMRDQERSFTNEHTCCQARVVKHTLTALTRQQTHMVANTPRDLKFGVHKSKTKLANKLNTNISRPSTIHTKDSYQALYKAHALLAVGQCSLLSTCFRSGVHKPTLFLTHNTQATPHALGVPSRQHKQSATTRMLNGLFHTRRRG